jgi:hypothetical protein
MADHSTVPGFKVVLTAVGTLYGVLGASMLVRGHRVAMTPFGVPEATLASPHFADFFHFTFVHMVVLGVLILIIGQLVDGARRQRIAAGILFFLQAHYAYLDFRTSDSPLGNGLYQGKASIVPALIDLAVALSFAFLVFRRRREAPAVAAR